MGRRGARLATIQYVVAIWGCVAATTRDQGHQFRQAEQLEHVATWRELQGSDGTAAGHTGTQSAGVHECILCWALALGILAGAASALRHLCRHKWARANNDEVKTPLSATAASANPFANDPTSEVGSRPAATSNAGQSDIVGEGLSAKGRFSQQKDTS